MTQTRTFFRPATLALTVGLGALAALPALAQGPGGHTMGRGEGRGMERMAERMKERCEKFEANLAGMDKKLTADQVRDIVAGRLAERANPNIKVGKTQTKGEIVTVEIVTKTGAVVDVREISTKTGLPANAGQRCDKLEERIEKARADRADGDHKRSPGRMGRGGGRDGGMGLGLFGSGRDRDLDLTADQVKTLAEARLILSGNPRLKVGAVKEKDKDTYVVDIVAADNSLVVQREVDKTTGRGN